MYEYSCRKCEDQHGKAAQYVGLTQTSLSRRLTYHLSKGSIKEHSMQNHQAIIDRKTFEENTKIIEKDNNRQTLAIKEAIIILTNNPIINKQFDKFDNILRIHHGRPYFSSNTLNSEIILQTETDSVISTSNYSTTQESSIQTALSQKK